VVDYMQSFNGSIQWNTSFTKPRHDWKVDLVTSFFDLFYSIRLRQGGEDKICWTSSKKRRFEVSSFIMRHIFLPVSHSLGRVFGECRSL
jgi:hypothetical protein